MHSNRRSSQHSTKQGFALIAALTLMAFILILIVSMTILIRVETQAGSTAQSNLQAKEAARLGLMMAIGELQKHAGPDQRVTARAEITGVKNNNRYWTGVWDTTSPSTPPAWLVSGDVPDPTNQAADTMQLVGPGTVGSNPDAYVNAPVIEIPGTGGQPLTQIAWWISDEGVKASISLEDKVDELNSNFLTDYNPSGLPLAEQRQLLKQISPRRFRTELFTGEATNFVPGEIEDISEKKVADKIKAANHSLRKAQSLKQAEMLDGVEEVDLENNYHDLGYLAEAVIANTSQGGLKKDLSDQTFNDTSGAIKVDESLRKFLWHSAPDADGNIDLKGLPQADLNNLSTGDIVNTTPPILTELSLYFAVSGQTANSRTARGFLSFEAEVWSPYGFRHNFTGNSGSNTPEIFVEIDGLPEVTLRFFDKDQNSFTNSTTLDLNKLEPEFRLDLTNTHKSGEIRKAKGIWPSNASSSNNQTNFYYTNDWDWEIDDPSINLEHRKVSFPEGDSINYYSEKSLIKITIKNSSGDILQSLENIPMGEIKADFGFYEDSPSGLEDSDAPIAFYLRLYDDRAALESWLTEKDLRAIIWDLKDDSLLELVDINDVDGDGLGDADSANFASFSNQDFLHGQVNNNFFRLFDIPATVPFSLGILQHLSLKDTAPFSIGNRWGGKYNGVFDQYFLSGIPQDSTSTYWSLSRNSPQDPLPNPALRVYSGGEALTLEDLIGDESARYLLISGNFNINSTSAKAWQALLASNYIYNWKYNINVGTSTEENDSRLNLEGSFFRLPFSGHNSSQVITKWKFPFEDYEEEAAAGDDYPELSDNELELIFRNSDGFSPLKDWRPSLAIGHRELSTAKIADLANNLVSALEARGRPFNSIEEFTNSGLLQDSIDQTAINTIRNGTSYSDADTSEKMPRNAPAYLSQADIISAIAPYITARTDTFRIHTRAKILNPETGKREGQAACIALVQRVPTRNDENPDNIMKNATGNGRKFIIKNIEWLSVSDL